ncbi:MAG: heavy metal translocating P-type ATPase [Candidatus Onthovivens sp.]|nr:heavy metal translocating P-type ATPase [Candidatus Onthovivens sp.]
MKLSKKQKKELIRIIIALVLFIVLLIIDKVLNLETIIPNANNYGWLLPFFLYLSLYLYIGYDVLYKAIRNIFHGEIFDENFLMCLATIGAFGIKEFSEGVAVLLLYQIGEWFQDYAVKKSRKSISSLMDIRPDYANLIKDNGKVVEVDPNELKVDDFILIKPGEKVPVDGIIVEGTSSLDTKALTGESLPFDVNVNNKVISGSINLTGLIKVKVEKKFQDSTVSKILDLVENASSKKSKSENFITKFAKIYTPLVVLGAVLLVIIGGAITNEWIAWLERSLNFLVVACPCALVISVPLSFFAGIGCASKYGILIKGSSYVEKLNKANVFIFDKTGTLTKGNFVISKIYPEDKKDEILKYAAICEYNSNHPIALAIKKSYTFEVDNTYDLIDVAGKGLIAKKDNELIFAGNNKLMLDYNINVPNINEIGTTVYIAKNNQFIGYLVVSDEIKEDSKKLIKYLKQNNIKTIMFTGDNEKIASSVANELCISEYKASLLPQNKAEELKNMLNNKNKNDVICFVGDGINDAPSLMMSDIGISMGGIGSDAAIEASDIVLMHDDLDSLIIAKKIAKKTLLIVKENIIFAILIKVLVLILSICGYAFMWLAICADVGVCLLAILNSLRANSKYKK